MLCAFRRLFGFSNNCMYRATSSACLHIAKSERSTALSRRCLGRCRRQTDPAPSRRPGRTSGMPARKAPGHAASCALSVLNGRTMNCSASERPPTPGARVGLATRIARRRRTGSRRGQSRPRAAHPARRPAGPDPILRSQPACYRPGSWPGCWPDARPPTGATDRPSAPGRAPGNGGSTLPQPTSVRPLPACRGRPVATTFIRILRFNVVASAEPSYVEWHRGLRIPILVVLQTKAQKSPEDMGPR